MTSTDKPEEGIEWELATWEGAQREAIRRWAALPLERIVAALEEMQELGEALSQTGAVSATEMQPLSDSAVHEQNGDYDLRTDARSLVDKEKRR
ncbi:MAG: hypothetical protein PVF07_12815 [Thiogranum sp.]|jgi:hypothetical protein